MMKHLKANVDIFNKDVKDNLGYRYTSNAPFSAFAANKRITRITIELIPPSSKSLIDIGCGDGTYADFIKKEMKSLSVEGTDPAREAIKIGQNKFPGIRFFVSNILDESSFQGKAGRYDVGVIRGVLHHLVDPAQAIRNSLKMADTLIIIEPNGNNPILKLIEKTSRYHIEHEEQSFSLRQLKAFCRNAGGKVAKVRFVGYVPFFFPEIPARIIYFFQPLLEHIPVFRRFFSAQIVILCKKESGPVQ